MTEVDTISYFGSKMPDESTQHLVNPFKQLIQRSPFVLSDIFKSLGEFELSVEFAQ